MIDGTATGPALVLDEPLSLWGGLDAETGVITDVHHPQHGQCITGTVLVMSNGRGSSSASSVLAEAVRLGTSPAAFILSSPDEILALGALVGQELYGVTTPLVVAPAALTAEIATGEPLATAPGVLPIDPTDRLVAARIVEIQMAAYRVEAELIGFDGIPQLTETISDVQATTDLTWRGIFCDLRLVGIIGWQQEAGEIDIDRLAVHPQWSRRGLGRALVRAVPASPKTIVSTVELNLPAVELYRSEGFLQIGRTEIASGIYTAQFERTQDT